MLGAKDQRQVTSGLGSSAPKQDEGQRKVPWRDKMVRKSVHVGDDAGRKLKDRQPPAKLGGHIIQYADFDEQEMLA